ncbi:MAG: hypothetical protein IJS45_06010 [Clostridia bacterium]|nr:hypothetical protein [Clostridia bacterium]
MISIMNVVVKVNRSLISLEETVRQLRTYMERQGTKNEHFYSELNIFDKRVTVLEEKLIVDTSPRDGIKPVRRTV